MFAPISWLQEFVNFNLSTKDLAWRLTELGLGVEKTLTIEGEEVFELEITPNRPDLLSIIGISREIAAIVGKKVVIKPITLSQPLKKLTITVHNNFKLFPRYTGIILSGITIQPSPEFIKKRLKQLNLRPINNIVDITNFVMYETGIPLHAFDYDKIAGHEMTVTQASGGEPFTTVDEKTYQLLKGAIIIKDSKKIIDLCGIKGGLNSAVTRDTKTVYLQVTADDPILIRKASQALALRSDASSIFERGVDQGGLIQSLTRAASLMQTYASAQIASDIIDLEEVKKQLRKVNLSLDRLAKVLGTALADTEVISILDNLSLNPTHVRDKKTIQTVIPSYRGDLAIEEDLMEEVARIYGYNRFTPTLPSAAVPTHPIRYGKDYSFESKIKHILIASGFSEVYTYSLISGDMLTKLKLDPASAIRLKNPISADYEYLRPTLMGNLLSAIKLNQSHAKSIHLFEIGRIYKEIPKNTAEPYKISFISSDGNYRKLKGVIEDLFNRLAIGQPVFNQIPGTAQTTLLIGSQNVGTLEMVKPLIVNNFELKTAPVFAEIDFTFLETHAKTIRFIPVSSYPEMIEDLTIIIRPQEHLGDIISQLKNLNQLISSIELLDSYNDSRTLRIHFHDSSKTLSQKDALVSRNNILEVLENRGIKVKN